MDEEISQKRGKSMDFMKRFFELRTRSKRERDNRLANKLIVKDMPNVYGLMAIASSSGLSGQAALRCVAQYVPISVAKPIEKAVKEIDAGKSFSESLIQWNDYPHLRSLSHILVESMESGTDSLPTLDALTRDATNKVRRNTEAAIKRLPVTMLFPLVLCILPAFLLLSVVPTLISGFMSFDW